MPEANIFQKIDEMDVRREIARNARRNELLLQLLELIRAEKRDDPPTDDTWAVDPS